MSVPALTFKITEAGRAAIMHPPTGIVAPFGFLAVGCAAGYHPNGAETALRHEFMRAPLGAGTKPEPTKILFAALMDGPNIGWITEIGLFLQDGTLWAVWSEDPARQYGSGANGAPRMGAPLGYKSFGIPYTISALIAVAEFSIDALPIVVNAAPITLAINLVENHLSNLLALVALQARGLRALEAQRRVDEARIFDLSKRLSTLELV